MVSLLLDPVMTLLRSLPNPFAAGEQDEVLDIGVEQVVDRTLDRVGSAVGGLLREVSSGIDDIVESLPASPIIVSLPMPPLRLSVAFAAEQRVLQ